MWGLSRVAVARGRAASPEGTLAGHRLTGLALEEPTDVSGSVRETCTRALPPLSGAELAALVPEYEHACAFQLALFTCTGAITGNAARLPCRCDAQQYLCWVLAIGALAVRPHRVFIQDHAHAHSPPTAVEAFEVWEL